MQEGSVQGQSRSILVICNDNTLPPTVTNNYRHCTITQLTKSAFHTEPVKEQELERKAGLWTRTGGKATVDEESLSLVKKHVKII